MFKNIRKLTAILLASILCLTSMMTVFAEGDKDSQGEPVEAGSEAVKLETKSSSSKNSITASPTDVIVKEGETAVFTVTVSGKVRSYQWQVSKNGGKTWSKLSGKTKDTLKVTAKAELNGYVYRCKVTFKDLSVKYSEPARLSIAKEMPAQSFGSEEEGLSVEAPEGAFPEGTTMETETPALEDVEAVLDNSGVKGSVLSALDLTFYNDGVELQPSEAVTVSFQAEAGMDPSKLALYHIDANADGLRAAGLEAEELGFTYDSLTGVVTFEGTHFSTYSLVWTEDGTEKSATIRWGYMDGDEFVGLEEGSTVTLDTTAATVSLINSYSGYYFIGATYKANSSANSVDISPAQLVKADDGWQITVVTNNEDDTTTTETVPVADGSSIWVWYGPVTEPNPSGSGNEHVPSPITQKNIKDNEDGTYTITLDITGTQITETTSVGANVLVVLDRTRSMASNMTTTKTRWKVAQDAVSTLVEALDCDTNDIDLALVTFYRVGETHTWSGSYWTKDGDAFDAYVQAQNYQSGNQTGTNWESGLYYARQVLTSRDSDPTYVIFLTDGEPNRRGTTSYQTATTTAAISYAQDQAEQITALENVYLYGIFCGSDSGYDNLADMIEAVHGEGTINGTSEQAITNAFNNIAQTIVNNLGASNVSVDDGIPSLSGISANVSGEAGGYEYYKKEPTDTDFVEWADAPGAIYSADNGVTWDISAAGTLPAGTTYRIKFTVWPSQEAYDLLADLNNGIKNLPLSDDEMAQLVIKIGNNSRYVYTPGGTEGSGTWTGGLTTAQMIAAINAAEEAGTEVTYSVPTNTHLRTSYSFNGTTYTDVPTGTLPSEDMLLEDTTISVEKLWHNYLDSRTDADIDGLQMVLSRDGVEYLEFEVSADTNWKAENIFISCGVISGGVVKEKGHDYFVTEKAAEEIDKTAYWEVNSDVYHPMVIDGTMTMLIKVETEAEADYTIDGKYYKVDNTAGSMSAINERVSWLNLVKAQTDGINPDDFFEFTVKIDEAKENDIYFSVFGGGVSYREDVEVSENVTTYRDPSNNRLYYVVPSGETFTLKVKPSWSVRFLNLYTGSTYTISESGMPNCYEFLSAKSVETMYKAYHDPAEGYPKTTNFTENNITGTINSTNTDYTVTVTNKPLYFFVYHSSDNKIEKIQMDDDRIDNGKFNMVEETKTGYLYGGYYKAYTKAGMTDAQILEATYAEGSSGSYAYTISHPATGLWTTDTGSGVAPYTGATVSFKNANAYTAAGNAMVPVAGTVYYLKEIPDQYFRPATYVIYDRYSANLDLKKMYMLSVTDDSLYQMVGIDGTIDLGTTTKLYSTFKVTNDTGTTETIKVSTINSNLSRGFLTVWDACDKIKAGTYTMTPYFVTKDGIKVTSAVTRTLTISDKLSYTTTDFISNDAKVASTYLVYAAPASGDGE